MENAILTGSRVYGTPTPDSDLDVVMLMDAKQIAKFAALVGEGYHQSNILVRYGLSCTIKINTMFHKMVNDLSEWTNTHQGTVNLLLVDTSEAFEAWKIGTEELTARKPVTRDEAVEVFQRLREERGLKELPEGKS
jgi:Nucleotidyltransferase domain